MKRKIYVANIYKNKKGNKYIYLPNDFPTERCLVKVFEDHIEISPIDYKKYYSYTKHDDIIEGFKEINSLPE